MKGKFIGVGVGPGDPELMTVKAVKIIKSVPVICAPRSSPHRPSIALKIIKNILKKRNDKYEVIEPVFPMIENKENLKKYWDHAAEIISEHLSEGKDVAFVTIGDPSLYSTFTYICRRIKKKFQVEMIPGICSFTSCAASACLPLAEKDETLLILPNVNKKIKKIIGYVDTVVVMKTSRHGNLLKKIVEEDPRKKKIISVVNCSMKNEKIVEGFVEDGGYLCTTLIKFLSE